MRVWVHFRGPAALQSALVRFSFWCWEQLTAWTGKRCQPLNVWSQKGSVVCPPSLTKLLSPFCTNKPASDSWERIHPDTENLRQTWLFMRLSHLALLFHYFSFPSCIFLQIPSTKKSANGRIFHKYLVVSLHRETDEYINVWILTCECVPSTPIIKLVSMQNYLLCLNVSTSLR